MNYLEIIRRIEAAGTVQPERVPSLSDDIDEFDETSVPAQGEDSSTSSNSLDYGTTSVDLLRLWLDAGVLSALPDPVPGFDGELARYANRAYLIFMVAMILDSVPWSLTASDRAVQIVGVLAPIVGQSAA